MHVFIANLYNAMQCTALADMFVFNAFTMLLKIFQTFHTVQF